MDDREFLRQQFPTEFGGVGAARPSFIPEPTRSESPSTSGGAAEAPKRMTNAEKKHAKLMKADKNFGDWQKHTKGIGSKLLLQVITELCFVA